MNTTVKDIAQMIDHSLLHPTMTDQDIIAGCNIAKKYEVASVCVKPYSIPTAVSILSGSIVKVGAVIGFPHGNSSTAIKVEECKQACESGATEIDMVINIGKALSDEWKYVQDEIEAINSMALQNEAILKVIFENDFLEEKTIIKLCELCNKVNVAFTKTSSGYGFVKQENGLYDYKGATLEHLRIMMTHKTPSIQVKAAGGVRTLADLLAVRALGVTRIGASATEAIIGQAEAIVKLGKSLDDPSLIATELGGGY